MSGIAAHVNEAKARVANMSKILQIQVSDV